MNGGEQRPPEGELWLAQLVLDPRNRSVVRDLSDVRHMHRTVMRLLPSGLGDQPRAAAGVLYRVEESVSRVGVLIQTRIQLRGWEQIDGVISAGCKSLYRG